VEISKKKCPQWMEILFLLQERTISNVRTALLMSLRKSNMLNEDGCDFVKESLVVQWNDHLVLRVYDGFRKISRK
jgi:hypothetical protein